MNELFERITQLWDIMHGSNNELISSANEELTQYFSDPNLILPLLDFYQETTNAYYKNSSIIYFGMMIKRFIFEIKDIYPVLVEKLMILIPNIPNSYDRKIASDELYKINAFIDEKQENLYSFCYQLIQNPSTIDTGIYLLSFVLPDYVESLNEEIIGFVFPIITENLGSELKENRNNAYLLTNSMFGKFDELNDVIDQMEDFAAKLIENMNMLFTTRQDNNEAIFFFQAINTIIERTPNFIYQYIPNYFETLIEVLKSPVDSMIQNNAITSFETVCDSSFFLIEESIDVFIHAHVIFELTRLQEDPTSNDYLSSNAFFHKASLVMIESEMETYEVFAGIFNELISEGTTETYIIGFTMMTSITENLIESIIEDFDTIDPILLQALTSGSLMLIEEACEFISIIVMSDEGFAPRILNKYEQVLLVHLHSEKVLKVLSIIYDYANESPKDAQNTISVLINQLAGTPNQQHQELLVDCISYIICNFEDIDPESYNIVKQVLYALNAAGGSARGSAIFCFSSFARCNPTLVYPDLQELITAIIESLKEQDDIELLKRCCVVCQNLLITYSTSLEDYTPTIFELLINVFTNENEPEMEEEEENDRDEDGLTQYDKKLLSYQDMKGQALIAVTTLFAFYPTQLSDKVDNIHTIIVDIVGSNMTNDLFNAGVESMVNLIEGLSKLNCDVSHLLVDLLDMTNAADDIEPLEGAWKYVAQSLRFCTPEVLSNVYEKFLNIFMLGIKCQKEIYMQSKKQRFLNQKLVEPMMDSLINYILILGDSAKQSYEEIANVLVPLMSGSRKKSRGYVIRALAFMVFNLPTLNIAQNVIAAAYAEATSPLVENQCPVYDALSYLIRTDPSAISSNVGAILELTMQTIGKNEELPTNLVDSAVNLWCTCVQVYQLDVDQSQLEIVLEHLPPETGCFLLKFTIDFAIHAQSKWPHVIESRIQNIALNILISEDYIYRLIPQDQILFAAQVLLNYSPEEIEEKLFKVNEASLQKYKARLSSIQSGI